MTFLYVHQWCSQVATFGAALLDYSILTMSIAPVDVHEAQVEFALERGLPAMIGVLGTYRLPYPSRSFDLAHCSRCLVKWADYDGLYLMEVDRVIRPGGYLVLSGPPIGWRFSYKGWQRTAEDLEKEQIVLEDQARRLCWKKIAEQGPIAVWQKPTNHIHCAKKLKAWKSPHFCAGNDSDSAWYKELQPCITPLPNVKKVRHTSGGLLEKWPKRLNVAPPRIASSRSAASALRTFDEDNQLWKRRVQHYGRVLGSLSKGGYRNVIDMNAGLGGFAAALSSYPLWVMNVVPFDSEDNSLGAIYERGLIGTYMNWCEAFSTYPRTYDLIHADGIFSIYMKKCEILDILFEIYRVLRPHGAVIVRDHVDVVVKVKDLMENMGWNPTLSHSEVGPHHPEKVLFVDNLKSM
uniref:Methyltransferase n=1 Tax=Opuntia streptacantha TaxID=393608 RepID=A0A7C9D7B0_OPUST